MEEDEKIRYGVTDYTFDVHEFLSQYLMYENVHDDEQYTAEHYAKHPPDNICYAAWIDEKLIAVIALDEEDCASNQMSIKYLAVENKHRRQGIGKNLIKFAFVSDIELYTLHVYPHRKNLEGIKFYEKLGFMKETYCECSDCIPFCSYMILRIEFCDCKANDQSCTYCKHFFQ